MAPFKRQQLMEVAANRNKLDPQRLWSSRNVIVRDRNVHASVSLWWCTTSRKCSWFSAFNFFVLTAKCGDWSYVFHELISVKLIVSAVCIVRTDLYIPHHRRLHLAKRMSGNKARRHTDMALLFCVFANVCNCVSLRSKWGIILVGTAEPVVLRDGTARSR